MDISRPRMKIVIGKIVVPSSAPAATDLVEVKSHRCRSACADMPFAFGSRVRLAAQDFHGWPSTACPPAWGAEDSPPIACVTEVYRAPLNRPMCVCAGRSKVFCHMMPHVAHGDLSHSPHCVVTADVESHIHLPCSTLPVQALYPLESIQIHW